jgi:hypothetical protein
MKVIDRGFISRSKCCCWLKIDVPLEDLAASAGAEVLADDSLNFDD